MSASYKNLFSVALFALFSISLALLLIRSRRESSVFADSVDLSGRVVRERAAQFARFEAREKKVAETVWGKEILAQECGWTFEALWDSLNAATNKLRLAASFPTGEIVMGKWQPPQALPHEIELREPAGPGSTLTAEEWRRFVPEFERDGWELAQTEFRHNRFETDEAGQPRQSHFYFSAHLINHTRSERAILEGDLIVDWASKRSTAEPAVVKRIDTSRLTIKTRRGEPPFKPILMEQILPKEKSNSIDPLILYDLDGDGLSEIILAANNVVYRRDGEGHYRPEPLCRYPLGLIFTGVIADFDGDGAADFLCAKSEGLVLFKGSPQGSFDEPGRLVWPASRPLQNVMVLTCGDIDHDGDLDVFLAQYKVPTFGQIVKPNYYDANDGYPSYLLLNDGQGNFTNATAVAALEKKRWRRTNSASFVDLNDDGYQDLLVVSDFAGVDLYRNDGEGHFADVTREWAAESHAFGMAHALADFNADGQLDFVMTGMNSPTVERLDHLGLWRPNATEDRAMRSRMTFGNRLYLARSESGFGHTPLSDSVARSGWSWGCGAFDFDNDGFPDVYVANGFQSRRTVKDYESEFWLHDIYVDDSIDDLTASDYFMAKYSRTLAQGWSYGGYEKNRLFFNQRGSSFVEIGHLMGVALEADSRCVVADDLDGDGRMDLLVTTFEIWPETKQTVRVYQNTLNDSGNWIGFRFREEGGGKTPVGTRVVVRYDGHSAVRQIVTGDSYRSQHANTVHFGLGKADRVDRVEIRWPNGQTITLREPALNRYHSIRASAQNPAPR